MARIVWGKSEYLETDFIITEKVARDFDLAHLDDYAPAVVNGHQYRGYYIKHSEKHPMYRVTILRDEVAWSDDIVIGHRNIAGFIRHRIGMELKPGQLEALYTSGTLNRPDPLGDRIRDGLARLRKLEGTSPDDLVGLELGCGCRPTYERRFAEDFESRGTLRCEKHRARQRVIACHELEGVRR